jgi:two-component system, OmpR family, phosphate regulon sensor histidine kinase PhoR
MISRASKNATTIGLMLSSIALLLVLQAFWLKSAYRDASDDFRTQTNTLFRATVLAMHDSLIQRNLIPASNDTLMKQMKPRRLRFAEADAVFSGLPPQDSVINYVNITDRSARIEVIMSREPKSDSIQKILRPIISKLQSNKEPRNFILKLGSDTLNVDSIQFFYAQALADANIRAKFRVIAIHDDPEMLGRKILVDKNSVVSETVRLNPLSRYAVVFPDINALLLREITPQILFSVFLTLLTIGSFYVMFRNIRAQQKLMEIKNDFISNITHELKTPVATVSVALEALKNFKALNDPQKTAEYLDIAQSELNRLTLMTDKILKTAVFEDKGVELKVESFDLDSLTQQVLSSMKLVFEKRKTHVTYTKSGNDFTLEAGQTHITNVLYNLIDNALKYSAEEASIEISLHENESHLILSVKDNGIGIEPQFQKKIFEKFFRVPSGDVHNTKGYGLGLSYVASVVKIHGGDIVVESVVGQGSKFIISLPKRHED